MYNKTKYGSGQKGRSRWKELFHSAFFRCFRENKIKKVGFLPMEQKKILYAATVVKTHIMQFHVPYLNMLKDMGWETAVAAKNDYEDPADCVIPGCDTYYDIPFDRLPWKAANIRAYRQLKAVLEENHYDIVHCHTPVGAMVTRLAAAHSRKQGTKVVYTAHGFHFFKGAPLINWLLYYPAEWLLGPLTDVLVTINQEDYRFAKKHIHAKKVVYIPGVGIDTANFLPDSQIRMEKRRELGLGEDDFVILTVAEMTKNKNHATVLRALAQLKGTPEFSKLRYLICGRGAERENLEALTEELGLTDHVRFLGYRQDAPDLYRASDLFAFMSFREGLPVALMEAMSSGLPVVCARIRGNTDLVEDGVSGIFSENTPQAVAENFLALQRDPELRQRLGRAASRAMSRYDAKTIHGEMKQIYSELMEQ